jgi:hypothetical protein
MPEGLRRGARIVSALLLAACTAAAPDRQPAIDCMKRSMIPSDGVVVVTWKTPLPGFDLTVDTHKLMPPCWVPLDSKRPMGWFPMPARTTGLSYYVVERERPWRSQQFDDYQTTCDERATLKVQVETRLDTHGQLSFEAVAVGDRCRPARTTLKPAPMPLKASTWPPHDVPCCGRAPKRDGEE